MHGLFLLGGILSELAATIMLRFSNGFANKGFALICLLCYGLSYFLVSCAMRVIPLSVAYATWCGAGTLLTMLIGIVFFKEKFKLSGYVGFALLIVGIIGLNLL